LRARNEAVPPDLTFGTGREFVPKRTKAVTLDAGGRHEVCLWQSSGQRQKSLLLLGEDLGEPEVFAVFPVSARLVVALHLLVHHLPLSRRH